MVSWYIFPHFGMLYQEKSGNPDVSSRQEESTVSQTAKSRQNNNQNHPVSPSAGFFPPSCPSDWRPMSRPFVFCLKVSSMTPEHVKVLITLLNFSCIVVNFCKIFLYIFVNNILLG
jgi:hypothetical protein